MWGGFADTHDRLSFRCQSIVWFLTLWSGNVSGLVTGYLPEAFPNCRTRGSKLRVLTTEHRACSRNSENGHFVSTD